ncbi:MAG TPA: 1-phosphofructokinase [Clostridiaceae bacterium]|nr:1-phosphofructokinase [Clostridiaceae bacterium]
MIYTVTLNPSFDQTIVCEKFQINALNRAIDTRQDIGGKGINVSKMIEVLGGSSRVFGLLPENGSTEFINSMREFNLADYFVIVPHKRIRTNLKIVDQSLDSLTEINQTGPEVPLQYLEIMVEKMLDQVSPGDIMVLSGSIPQNFPPDTYQQLINVFNQRKCKIILDADGKNLQSCLSGKEKPYFIKPNLLELEQLTGKQLNTIAEIDQATEPLLNRGVRHILVSLGAKGAFYTSAEQKYLLDSIDIEVKSPVGAGDSMVAAFAFGLQTKQSIEETLRFAIAAATAMVNTAGTSTPDYSKIVNLLSRVNLRTFDQ